MTDVMQDRELAILEQRARALAQPADDVEPSEAMSVAIVVIAGERYALPTDCIEEVQPASPATPVPRTAGFWVGLANVRGDLQPVLDLRTYLGLTAISEGTGVHVLVSAAGVTLALLVDGVEEIHDVPVSDIRPAPEGMPQTVARGIRGVTADLVSVVDLESMLSDPRLVVDEQPARRMEAAT